MFRTLCAAILVACSALASFSNAMAANENTLIKPIISHGNLNGIKVTINNVRLTVGPKGKLIALAQKHASNVIKTAKPNITYQAPSLINRHSKQVTSINDIHISYYSCQQSHLYQSQGSGNGIPTPNALSKRTRELQNQIAAVYTKRRCINGNGTSGKVHAIGKVLLTYYPESDMTATNYYNQQSGSAGKIQSVGPYHFTYYPLGTPGDKGGKIQYMANSKASN